MLRVSGVGYEQVRKTCAEESLDFTSTGELPSLVEVIGQQRAVEAVEFGMDMDGDGYNIYALGPAGAGRTSIINRFVEQRAKEKPVPDDWCYVYNFRESHKPEYLRFRPGKGREFRSDMDNLIKVLRNDIQQAMQREDYEMERNAIMQEAQKTQNEKMNELHKKAREQGFELQQNPRGIFVVPFRDGKTMSPKEFSELPEEERKSLEEKGQALQKDMQRAMRSVRDVEIDANEKLRKLERDTVLFAVEHHIDKLKEKYSDQLYVKYLDEVKEDVVSNPKELMSQGQQQEAQMPVPGMAQQSDPADKYKVNLIVDNSETNGAPVVMESNPTFQNLIGKIERQAQFGMLTTNYNMIKAGALHRATGGYLIIEADALLRSPFSYYALKRVFKDREIKIYDMGEMYSPISTSGLEPQPIPFDVKIILIGNPMIYYLLFQFDEEFRELFKIKADFNVHMDRNDESIKMYAQFLGTRCREDGLCHFDKSGIARMVEYGSELVGDQTKLSTRFGDICALAREASHWAGKEGSGAVSRDHVQKAIDAKIRRSNRVEELIKEMIHRGDIFIDTEGEAVGQVNGLSVMMLGDYAFGRPSRVTARTYIGKGSVINIEREAKMSGPIHDKGVMILGGYLHGTYGQERPVSLAASIGFEQSYSGIEGDSASSTELYALLSSLSGFPIKQNFAVTGSVNQHGHIQPIGGATEKVEGFFDVCKAKGFTGDQGVIIPEANVKNLMVREEIVNAVREGSFHIHAVKTIEEGMEILTGKECGTAGPDGEYPGGTIHHAVAQRLYKFSESWARHRTAGDGGPGR